MPMLRMALLAWTAPVVVTLVACSSSSGSAPAQIHASDYDQRCTTASDCVVVNDGDVCGCQGCGTAAVSQSAAMQYQADYQKLRSACGPSGPCPALLCVVTIATCSAGTCQVCHTNGCAGAADAGTD